MPQGLEVYDASGNLINTSESRFPKIVGVIQINGTDGQQSISIPSGSTPVYFLRNMSNNIWYDMPYVTITNTQISWEYRKYGSGLPSNTKANAKVSWGYY